MSHENFTTFLSGHKIDKKKNFFFTIYNKNIFTPFIASATVFISHLQKYHITHTQLQFQKKYKFDLQKNTHHISLSFIVFCPYCMKFMINSFTPYIFPFYIHIFFCQYIRHTYLPAGHAQKPRIEME